MQYKDVIQRPRPCTIIHIKFNSEIDIVQFWTAQFFLWNKKPRISRPCSNSKTLWTLCVFSQILGPFGSRCWLRTKLSLIFLITTKPEKARQHS